MNTESKNLGGFDIVFILLFPHNRAQQRGSGCKIPLVFWREILTFSHKTETIQSQLTNTTMSNVPLEATSLYDTNFVSKKM